MTKTPKSGAQKFGRRLDPETISQQPLMWRVCTALDLPPRNLAVELGLPFEDIQVLLDDKHRLADMDYDETWQLVASYVDERIAALLAVRSQLNAQLVNERTRRAGRLAMTRHYKRTNPNV